MRLFEASPYYDENDKVMGWGVWSPSLGDWVIDDGLDETQAGRIAAYLNGKRDKPSGSDDILKHYALV